MMLNQKTYPTRLQVLGLIFLYLGLAVISGFLLVPVIEYDSMLQGLLTLLSYVVPMGLLSMFALRNTPLKWQEVFGSWPGMDSLSYLLLPALVLVNIFIVDPLISFVPMPEWMEQMVEEILQGLIKPNIGSFLTVVVAAAFLEEYLFRGIVLRGFLKNYSPTQAIIWSAVFFGLFHFNPWQFVAAFILGLYMGWLYYRTQSLWPCIAIHALNNLIGYVGFVFFNEDDVVIYDFTQNIPLAFLSIFGGVIGVYLLYKVLDQRLPASVTESNPEDHDAET